MSETGRWALPLLDAGQAQKEITVNEALARLDLLAQAGVEAVGIDAPPVAPAIGQAWIVGAAPTGAWAGQAGAIAGWTAGGWRYVAPREGLRAWSVADGCMAAYGGGAWTIGQLPARSVAIAEPSAGASVDAEARAAIGAILTALRGHGLIAP